jgi:hypothetical protein
MATNKKSNIETKKTFKKASFGPTPDLLKNNIFETKPAAPAPVVKAKAPEAPAAKPVVAAPKAPEAAKPVVAAKPAAKSVTVVTPEQRYKMIQDASYFKAEKDGFKGDSAKYWAAAEAEINAALARK